MAGNRRGAGPGPTLLLGAGGQLATDLARRLAGADLVALAHHDLDVTDPGAVERLVTELRPAVILNTAAANRVDDAESDPAPAFAVNAVAAHHLARIAARHQARLVHFSTDYVFGGAGPGPFDEEATPAPLNAYGVSKLAGEQGVRNADPRHLVVRSSGLYGVAGSRGKGGNFVETMLRLAREGKPIRVVDDQVLTPTSTADLADAVRRLLVVDPPGGVYHLTNTGACSWFEFARHIFALGGLPSELTPISSEAFGAPARRPANSVLADTRLAKLGLAPLRPWPDALAAYLRAKGHLPG
ncbi:MAG TPA: dTDP-4-dehydrorhamnose reductase [Methylomirabilota bacterium]|jgi:dTDP-4-dehydrorhamnose reductase|nr:dTDP-4-dehydrorhamnose reductase [Methylomirabilota bacterium]